jgi:hypothetical protein
LDFGVRFDGTSFGYLWSRASAANTICTIFDSIAMYDVTWIQLILTYNFVNVT